MCKKTVGFSGHWLLTRCFLLHLSVHSAAGSSLTCLGDLHQFIIAEFAQVLFHLRDGLGDGAKREVGVDGHCGQLLGFSLRDQHVVGLEMATKNRATYLQSQLEWTRSSAESLLCLVRVSAHLDKVDVVFGAWQLRDLLVSPLQVGDLMAQPLHVSLGIVERCPLVGGDQLGHLLLHPLDGANHVAERLLAFLQRSLGWVLNKGHSMNQQGVSLVLLEEQWEELSSLPQGGMQYMTVLVVDLTLRSNPRVLSELLSVLMDGGVTNLKSIHRLFQFFHLLESVMDLLLDLGLGGAKPLLWATKMKVFEWVGSWKWKSLYDCFRCGLQSQSLSSGVTCDNKTENLTLMVCRWDWSVSCTCSAAVFPYGRVWHNAWGFVSLCLLALLQTVPSCFTYYCVINFISSTRNMSMCVSPQKSHRTDSSFSNTTPSLPAPPLSPARPRPCRDLCVPSPCTARKCTSGRCGRTAPDPSDAAGRSACPGDRFHPLACASWRWPTRSEAWDASRSRRPDTWGRSWRLCASCPRRCHSRHPGVPRSCNRGTVVGVERTRCCVGGWNGVSLLFLRHLLLHLHFHLCVSVWASCCRWPCTLGRGTCPCGRHGPSRSSSKLSRRCGRTGWTRDPGGIPCTGSRSPDPMTWGRLVCRFLCAAVETLCCVALSAEWQSESAGTRGRSYIE